MKFINCCLLIIIACALLSCNEQNKNASTKSYAAIDKEIMLMMDSVSKDIATNPRKWTYYFEDTSLFYMASDGKLVFPNYDVAKKFISDTLSKNFSGVQLNWQNIHVDSIASNIAAINASYDENLTASNKSVLHIDGYCTAIADDTNIGWKFRSLHWSVSK